MESLLDLLAPLARLISIIVIIVLFFMCIVRPLLKYLSVNHAIEHRKRHDKGISIVAPAPGPDLIMESHHDDVALGDNDHGPRLSKKDMLNRLAASDPEKAGNLVKKWLNDN